MRSRRVISWLFVPVVLLETLGLGWFWFRAEFDEGMVIPHAIYATGQLVDAYHSYYGAHGRWPPPGTFAAKEAEYVSTSTVGTYRDDIFYFGGALYVDLELHPVGRLLTRSITADELRRRKGGNSVTKGTLSVDGNQTRPVSR